MSDRCCRRTKSTSVVGIAKKIKNKLSATELHNLVSKLTRTGINLSISDTKKDYHESIGKIA